MESEKCHKNSSYLRKLAFRYGLTAGSQVNQVRIGADNVCEASQNEPQSIANRDPNKTMNCVKTKNSIFKRLRKVQNRVIFCVSRQKVQSIESRHSLNAFIEEDEVASQKNESTTSLEVDLTPKGGMQQKEETKKELYPRYLINNFVIDDQNVKNGRIPTVEIFNLANSCWYWGPMTRQEAEKKLCQESDGSFLVRDSSSDSYLFTVSFRSVGHTFHARIEHARGCYSLFDQEGHTSVAELIENAMIISKESLYCYTRPRNNADPMFPVRLTSPVSRFTQLRTLKYLCRFVIRQFTNVNDISKLPIPKSLQIYLQQGHY